MPDSTDPPVIVQFRTLSYDLASGGVDRTNEVSAEEPATFDNVADLFNWLAFHQLDRFTTPEFHEAGRFVHESADSTTGRVTELTARLADPDALFAVITWHVVWELVTGA